MSAVDTKELKALYDYEQEQALVHDTVHAALKGPVPLVRFLGRYTSWNGFFGSGVAALAGKIGRSRRLFLDPTQPVVALADRSVFVASFFFDAARDEFDDRDTVHRDTHRCLAQSTLAGVIGWGASHGAPRFADPVFVNGVLADPPWLAALCARVRVGYGADASDDLPAISHGIGYHLGSEVLADKEFSVIDQTLRATRPDLVEHLQRTRVNIAGQEHVAWQWLGIHSGHGGGAEADHFEWATRGARLAFRFTPPREHDALRQCLHEGYLAFAHDHREFFTRVNAD
jgi:hypothetical protein